MKKIKYKKVSYDRFFLFFEVGLKSAGLNFRKYKKSFILRKYKKIFPLRKYRTSVLQRKYKYFFNIRSGKFPFPEI